MPRPLQIKQESTSTDTIHSDLLIPETSDKFHNCLVGGKRVKFMVDKQSSDNVMDLKLFQMLKAKNFQFFTTDMLPCKVGDFTFVGQCTTKLECNNQTEFINFSVREGTKDYVILTKNLADKLGIIENSND